MNHQRKKPSSAQIAEKKKKILQKYQNLSKKGAPTPINLIDIANAATVHNNNNTNIDDLIDNNTDNIGHTSNKNKNAQNGQ